MCLKAEPFPARLGVSQDPWAWMAAAVDTSFMSFYAHLRRNARRMLHLGVALLPLAVLLVGSCKTSAMPGSYGSAEAPALFRLALFPDSRDQAANDDYQPARGYINRAQKYLSGDPAALTKLSEREVGYIFGKPSMERRDADARIWQYRTEGCVVDVYFYQNAEDGGAFDVSYVDFRSGDDLKLGAPINDQPAARGSQSRCLRMLVSSGAAPSSRA